MLSWFREACGFCKKNNRAVRSMFLDIYKAEQELLAGGLEGVIIEKEGKMTRWGRTIQMPQKYSK